MSKLDVRFGDMIRLRGKTGKGKSRVGTYGEWWKVTMPRTVGADINDPLGVAVETAHPMSSRLIQIDGTDQNYEIMEVSHVEK